MNTRTIKLELRVSTEDEILETASKLKIADVVSEIIEKAFKCSDNLGCEITELKVSDNVRSEE